MVVQSLIPACMRVSVSLGKWGAYNRKLEIAAGHVIRPCQQLYTQSPIQIDIWFAYFIKIYNIADLGDRAV